MTNQIKWLSALFVTVAVAGGALTQVVLLSPASGDEQKGGAVTASDQQKFSMLNALWFKPDGGAETYDRYMKAAGPFVVKYGGKPGKAYTPEASIIGEFDADLVFFVEWPGEEAFAAFLQDPGYQAIKHLREEAIRDSLLIRCRPKQ